VAKQPAEGSQFVFNKFHSSLENIAKGNQSVLIRVIRGYFIPAEGSQFVFNKFHSSLENIAKGNQSV